MSSSDSVYLDNISIMKRLLLVSFLLTGTLAFSQLGTNLLSRYNFNGNVDDVSGNGLHAMPHNVSYVEDRNGVANSACYFNGIDSYVEFPNVSELKTALPVSFAFWIRYDSNDYHHQALLNTSFEENRSAGIWINSTEASGAYAVNFGDGQYAFTPETRRTFVSNSVIQTASWHHVTIVVNGPNDMDIYFDKQDHGGYYSGVGGPLVYSLAAGGIGRHDRDLGAPADYFMGAIDDFRYYNRALTQADVNEIYLLATDEVKREQSFVLYPNPTTNELLIKTNELSNFTKFEIYDVFGKKVLDQPFSDRIDVSGLSAGLYILNASNGVDSVSKKFVKN